MRLRNNPIDIRSTHIGISGAIAKSRFKSLFLVATLRFTNSCLSGGALQSKVKAAQGGRGSRPAGGCACQDRVQRGKWSYMRTQRTRGECLFHVPLLVRFLFAFALLG
jgi:hypothetical protein